MSIRPQNESENVDICSTIFPTHAHVFRLQVEKRVKAVFGERHYPPYTIVVCMLLLEGADLYQKNLTGDSPLAICPPDITHLVRNVVEMCG